MVRAVVAPASGPRWVAMAGLDRALLERRVLGKGRDGSRALLVGASAGAWRAFAFACRRPLDAHRELLEGYISQVFPRGVSPALVSAAYRRLLGGILTREERAHILGNPRVDVAVHVTRARGPLGSRRRWLQAVGVAAAAAANAASPRLPGLFFERVLLHSRPRAFTLAFRGSVGPLTEANMVTAAVASGTVPLYMDPVCDLVGAPAGCYVDGGVGDYHLNQVYDEHDSGLTLLLHYQRDILPGWFDRHRSSRRPPPEVTDSVLQLYPSPAYVADLPQGRLPDRDDFLRDMDRPEERIRRWRQAAAASKRLGEQFVDDLDAGRIPDLVEPIE